MALGIGRLDPTGIHEHRQLADLTAGRGGGHHIGGEGHPRPGPGLPPGAGWGTGDPALGKWDVGPSPG
jgi:hypothetical protein